MVLLATNVLGDSLTLGRQVFSQSMGEWILRTVQHFAGRPEAQLVVRVHPGEPIDLGASVADIRGRHCRASLPKYPVASETTR